MTRIYGMILAVRGGELLVECPNCRRTTHLGPDAAGKETKCASCKAIFAVRDPEVVQEKRNAYERRKEQARSIREETERSREEVQGQRRGPRPKMDEKSDATLAHTARKVARALGTWGRIGVGLAFTGFAIHSIYAGELEAWGPLETDVARATNPPGFWFCVIALLLPGLLLLCSAAKRW